MLVVMCLMSPTQTHRCSHKTHTHKKYSLKRQNILICIIQHVLKVCANGKYRRSSFSQHYRWCRRPINRSYTYRPKLRHMLV